jgi:hypothetical protein
MKKSFLLWVLVFFTLQFNLLAQDEFPSELWHEGKLVLLTGDVIRGKIKYNLESDAVQINVESRINTFSARKILYFEIFDETVDRYRQFYALPFSIRPNYKVPLLFEVLYENTLTLLCRESIVQENIPQFNYYYGSRYSSRLRLVYEYYFLDKEGEIIMYTQKKEDLYTILSKTQGDLEQYIKKNSLRYDRQRDLVRITAYYNSLLNS